MSTIHKSAKIYIAGHRGMVGSALIRRLDRDGYDNLLKRTRAELDLLDQHAVYDFLNREKPDFIFIAAAKVGGILANDTLRGEFIYENLAIATHLIDGAHRAGVERLIFLGSSCIYPRECPQPMREEYLLTGPLEPTNEPYAVAKIAGIKLCEAYRHQYGRNYHVVMPTNLYGPNDSYDLNNCHVVPALIRKACEAKALGDDELVVWGTGRPKREFLHVDDLASACVYLMQLNPETLPSLLNIGSGEDLSIRELAELVMEEAGFNGNIKFDDSKPDGAPRKLLDISRMRGLGWGPTIDIREGIRRTVADYLVSCPTTKSMNR